MSAEEKLIASLIQCEACNKDISVLTEICPSCGAPNNWIHPSIKHFKRVKNEIEMSKEFTFDYDKTTIRGTAQAAWPWYHWAILLLLAILPVGSIKSLEYLPYGDLVAIVLIAFFYFVFYRILNTFLLYMYGNYDYFKADLAAGTWASTNDEFWQPVKDVLLPKA